MESTASPADLVPKPGVNLNRFHGVFVPNSKHGLEVTPTARANRTTDESKRSTSANVPRM